MNIRAIGIVIFICLVLKFEGNLFDTTGLYNACNTDRLQSKGSYYIKITNVLFDIEKTILLIVYIGQCYLNPKVSIKQSIFTIVWYILSGILVMELKELVADKTCGAGKSNSISGHFSFFWFYVLTLPSLFNSMPYLIRRKLKFNYKTITDVIKKATLLEATISYLYMFFCIFAGLITFGTWFYGFHSHSQILNGIIFGSISHYLCEYTLLHYNDISTMTKTLFLKTLLISALFILVTFTIGQSGISLSKII